MRKHDEYYLNYDNELNDGTRLLYLTPNVSPTVHPSNLEKQFVNKSKLKFMFLCGVSFQDFSSMDGVTKIWRFISK